VANTSYGTTSAATAAYLDGPPPGLSRRRAHASRRVEQYLGRSTHLAANCLAGGRGNSPPPLAARASLGDGLRVAARRRVAARSRHSSTLPVEHRDAARWLAPVQPEPTAHERSRLHRRIGGATAARPSLRTRCFVGPAAQRCCRPPPRTTEGCECDARGTGFAENPHSAARSDLRTWATVLPPLKAPRPPGNATPRPPVALFDSVEQGGRRSSASASRSSTS